MMLEQISALNEAQTMQAFFNRNEVTVVPTYGGGLCARGQITGGDLAV